MTVLQLRRETAQILQKAGIAAADFEADVIVGEVLGLGRGELIAHGGDAASETERCIEAAKRRASGEPLQYIIGSWEFYGLPFRVGPGVLIPRADTELLVDTAVSLIKDTSSAQVLDLCSGSGCVAVAVAKSLAGADVTAVEKYDGAYLYLEQNIALNGAAVRAVRGDVTEPPCVGGEFDLILSNPPYIRRGDIPSLQKEVGFEPKTALDGGDDGLCFYRAILELWLTLLKDGGYIAVEIGFDQSADVENLFKLHGLHGVKTVRDLNGLDRVVYGQRKI